MYSIGVGDVVGDLIVVVGKSRLRKQKSAVSAADVIHQQQRSIAIFMFKTL